MAGDLNAVIGQSDAGKLPAGFRCEKVTVAGADMRLRGYAGAPSQYHLVAHEFSVIFSQCAGSRLLTVIRQIGAGRPFPHIAKDLQWLVILRIAGARWMKP